MGKFKEFFNEVKNYIITVDIGEGGKANKILKSNSKLKFTRQGKETFVFKKDYDAEDALITLSDENIKVSDSNVDDWESYLDESKKYEVYHKSYTSAIDEMKKWVEKQGFTFGETKEQADDQLFNEIGAGPPKPSSGKTNRLHLEIWKNGKKQRKMVHVQVYNTGKSYELNTYIS